MEMFSFRVFSERHLCSFDCRHRFHFFQFVQMAVHLLYQRIFSLVQLEPHPLRRTLTLEGCGVFFAARRLSMAFSAWAK